MPKKYPTLIVLVFIWIGFICAISFMEAWVKFQAENVSLATGLSIGKVVFGALNKAEWAFSMIILSYLALGVHKIPFRKLTFFIIPFLILLTQTFLLLPLLSERADIVIHGGTITPSFLHAFYVVLETIKVVFLFIFGLRLIRHQV